jgi:hypothetical protein
MDDVTSIIAGLCSVSFILGMIIKYLIDLHSEDVYDDELTGTFNKTMFYSKCLRCKNLVASNRRHDFQLCSRCKIK